MKARDIIISLALLSLFLTLADCMQHLSKVLQARDTLRTLTLGDQNFEDVRDFLHGQCWSVAKDVVVAAAQGLVIFLVTKSQPNKSLHATAAAPGS
jgi:hypothetical protein